MKRWLALAVCALMVAAPVSAAEISGLYVEARTCDVWTGPCFANADMNLGGKHAVMAWKVQKGTLDNARLDGLGVVAVIAASDTLGIEQTGPAKAILIVDSKANSAQREALISMAKKQGGHFLKKIIAIETAPIDLVSCECKGGTCAEVKAGKATIKTRCIDHKHDKACGNESAYYPPLAKGVKAQAAIAAEHFFAGTGLNETWKDFGRRGAYVGSFSMR